MAVKQYVLICARICLVPYCPTAYCLKEKQ